MKQLRTIVIVFIAILFMGVFSACTNDETDQALTKSQLLIKKSKEFAKKYNVDLRLKEENIDKIAETLTVDQMEKDYQDFASSCGKVIKFMPPKSTNVIKTRNRILIRRKMQGMEYLPEGKKRFLCDTPHATFTEVISGYFELEPNGVGFLYMSSGATVCQGTLQEAPRGYFYDEKNYHFYAYGMVFWDSPCYNGTVYASGEFGSYSGNYVTFSKKK